MCGACLLRRQSLFAAGLDESGDRYLWCDISAANLTDTAAPGGRLPSPNDEKQAVCGALSMARFADLAAGGVEADHCVRKAAHELATVLGDEAHEIEAKLRCLITKHRDEWQAFVAKAGPGSFLARRMEGRPC
jgi:hypothetical protein